MKTLTLNFVKELLRKDIEKRPNNKSSNEPIIKLIDLINKPNATITIIETKGVDMLNRGVICECLIKMLIKKTFAETWAEKGVDLEYKGRLYEIKASFAKGYAHYNPTQWIENLIFMDRYGIYLTNGKNIVLDKCKKHIQTINKANATMLVSLA